MAHVLIVDRDPSGTHALTQALTLQGLEATVLSSGQEALEWAREHMPQAIVLSVELAGTSGYAICNRLKKDDTLKAIPLLLASSEASHEVFEEHRRLKTKADGYLFKPYDIPHVLQQLQAALDPDTVPPAAPGRENASKATDSDPLMSTDALLLLEGSVDVNKHTQVIKLPIHARGDGANDLIGAALADMDAQSTAAMTAIEDRVQQLEDALRDQASKLADQGALMTQLTDALARSEARQQQLLRALDDALQGSMSLCRNVLSAHSVTRAEP